jgi:VanZ family protein
MATTCREDVALGDGAARQDDHQLLLFTFQERQGNMARDLSGHNQSLLLPSQPMALQQTFLAPPWPNFTLSKTLLADIIINFLGFIPLGATLYPRLRLSSAFSGWYPARATMILCFAVSLAIELAQGWLPNRSSSLLDLVLNTAGAVLGVLLIKGGWNTIKQILAQADNSPPA